MDSVAVARDDTLAAACADAETRAEAAEREPQLLEEGDGEEEAAGEEDEQSDEQDDE